MTKNYAVEILNAQKAILEFCKDCSGRGFKETQARKNLDALNRAIADLEELQQQREMRREAEAEEEIKKGPGPG